MSKADELHVSIFFILFFFTLAKMLQWHSECFLGLLVKEFPSMYI